MFSQKIVNLNPRKAKWTERVESNNYSDFGPLACVPEVAIPGEKTIHAMHALSKP